VTGRAEYLVRLSFRTVFLRWFIGLLLCFLAANLLVRRDGMGLIPIRFMGFPYDYAVWNGSFMPAPENFDPEVLGLNVLIALAVSVPVATLCAWSRCRTRRQP